MPRKGQKMPESAKQKLRKLSSGSGNPFWGKRHSDETKKHWSSIRSGRKQSLETVEKRVSKMRGKTRNITWSEKMKKERAKTGWACGKNHWNWQGGKSRGKHMGGKYGSWRMSVFERDNFTCQKCGQIGGYLTAHHIVPFSQDKSLRYEITNGITYCPKCHAEEDEYFARFRPEIIKVSEKERVEIFY